MAGEFGKCLRWLIIYTQRFFFCVLIYGLVIMGQFLVDSWPVYQFQYPCHTDICTYPEQYCSSRTEKCEFCKYECNNGASFPLGCKTFCNQGSDTDSTRTVSWLHNEIWFVATIALPFTFLVIMVYLWFKGKLRFGSLSNDEADESAALFSDGNICDERSNTESVGSLSASENVKEDEDIDSCEKTLCEKKLYNVPPIGRDVRGSGEEINLVTSATPKCKK